MIVEWIRHRLTPAPRALRDMGYLRELIAIDARRRRHRRAWAPHLRAAQSMILDCAAHLDRWDQVVVVGAAQTADVPLDLLALLFRRVVLVDLMFLPAVRIAAMRMAPVALEPCDVTGVVEAVRTLPRGAPLPAPRPAIPDMAHADLVISCNVLSQLPLLPCRWLERRHGLDPVALEPFRRRLIADHLRVLSAAPCPVCLITDTERQVVVAGQPVEAVDLLHGIDPDVEGDAWWWAIAPRPEEAWTHDVRHRVIAGWLRGFSTPDDDASVADLGPERRPVDGRSHGGG
ncbi:hypothetical protein [Roseospira visakhapatnamensis]|uniref:Uncharacterized protein n=1 Tax=Roseospira visakhapatnamensis TaxID=390880 RepID=A0A7W6RFI1_9PROT|nr:hypothetical protein [Roseospira visakhapatnamensis]MBB4267342.1 hypothetical protein [Roseospira visakhapatnamensis]